MPSNYLRKAFYGAALLAFAGAAAFVPAFQPVAMAQTNISGDLAGAVTDPTGAAVPNAQITLSSPGTGVTKSATTDASGNYRIPLLTPGNYQLSITAPGFETAQAQIAIAAGRTNSGDVKLSAGNTKEVVNVTDTAPLLHTEDAQVSTSFDLNTIQNLPNPGNDLTFFAQTTPGAVMNTQGGYGNFSVFGLPATSNTFTVNGGYEGDPYLNLNNSGATNLLLGNNDIDNVTVTTNAYDAAFGGLGGAQVNEISRSGSNGFHGNATYWWNGSAMNANDYFINQAGLPKNFSNVNQWGAAIGGPIKRDKAYFFINTEGLRVIIPQSNNVTIPSAGFQSTVLNPVPTVNEYAPYGNLAANGLYSEAPDYQTIFNYYNGARNAGSAQPTSDPSVDVFRGQAANFASEWLITGRTDFNLGANDHLFVHFKVDKGLQPTYTSFISPQFDAQSPQPAYEGQLDETHTFSPSLTNQFLFAASYYRAIFTNTTAASGGLPLPYVFIPEGTATGGALGTYGTEYIGGEDFAFPQGRNVTGYQFNDDLSWTRGNHTFKAGFTMRRDDITDYTASERNYNYSGAENIILDEGDWAAGYSDEWVEQIPQHLSNPVALYVMGAYLQDTWKAMSNLTVTVGLRAEHNSNPICQDNCFSTVSAGSDDLVASRDTPYNSILSANRHRAYFGQQNVGLEPRVGFSWLPFGAGSKTVIRGGYGIFADYFPAQIAGSLSANSPDVNRWTILGAIYGNLTPFVPAEPGSGHQISLTSQAAFAGPNGFNAGASYNDLLALTGGAFRTPAITATVPHISLPMYNEYSLAVEQEFNRHIAGSVMYVGNHGWHTPISNFPNAFNTGTGGYGTSIASLPDGSANRPFPALATLTEYYSGGTTGYNGVIGQLTGRGKWGTLQFNYAFSHTLDEISNGGFDAFGVNPIGQINPHNLAQNYGNADYDVRHYISASYVLNVPYWGGPRVLTDEWQISGTAFHNTGYPFSVTDASGSTQYGSTPLAHQLAYGGFNSHCGGESHTVAPCELGTPGGSLAGFEYFAPATDYGQQHRNQFFGPNYTDFDLDVAKGFHVPGWESASFRVAAQFFNLFNHPNFQIPLADITDGVGGLGLLYTTQQTPTSILGAFLGGDASPRLIQLKASFVF